MTRKNHLKSRNRWIISTCSHQRPFKQKTWVVILCIVRDFLCAFQNIIFLHLKPPLGNTYVFPVESSFFSINLNRLKKFPISFFIYWNSLKLLLVWKIYIYANKFNENHFMHKNTQLKYHKYLHQFNLNKFYLNEMRAEWNQNKKKTRWKLQLKNCTKWNSL